MPKVVQLEVIFDAGFLNCGIVSFPHASNWLPGLAFRLFHATLQQFGHFFGHRNFPPRHFRIAAALLTATYPLLVNLSFTAYSE